MGDRVVPAAFAAAERGGLAPQCLAATALLSRQARRLGRFTLRSGSTGNRTPPFITGRRFSGPAADHSAGCLQESLRPVGRSRTSTACVSDPPVGTATTTGWSEAVESNHSGSVCRTAGCPSNLASGLRSLPAASRTRCNDLRRVASGSARTERSREPARSRTAPRWVAISADRWVSGSVRSRTPFGPSARLRRDLSRVCPSGRRPAFSGTSERVAGFAPALHGLEGQLTTSVFHSRHASRWWTPAGVAPASTVCGTALRPHARAHGRSARNRTWIRSFGGSVAPSAPTCQRGVGESNPLSSGRQPDCDSQSHHAA